MTRRRGVRIGAPSVGHSLYTMARLFAYMLDMKEPRFVTGYTPREIDFALESNEIDARVSILDSLLTRNVHWLDKDMVDIHATMDIPKGISHSHPRLAKLLEIESFARSNQDRRLIALFRGARDTGQPFVLPPATPADRVKILREAMRKAFADPDYVKATRNSPPSRPCRWPRKNSKNSCAKFPVNQRSSIYSRSYPARDRCRSASHGASVLAFTR